MYETPEYAVETTENRGKEPNAFSILRRYREGKRNLIKRADSLKGKDETRRKNLMKVADSMTGDRMNLEQIRRKAAIAEIDLLLDDYYSVKSAAKQ